MSEFPIELQAKFNKVYSNLPMGVRQEIIAVIDGEPMTWHVCRLEIEQRMELGDRILRYLNKLGII